MKTISRMARKDRARGRTQAKETASTTISDYLIQRLYDHGVRHVFGIPGDYVLTFYDLLLKSPLQIVTTCDEQGAGFAADAYARVRGLGVVKSRRVRSRWPLASLMVPLRKR